MNHRGLKSLINLSVPIFLILLSVYVPETSAQTQPSNLPPEAQEAMSRGLAAAKQQQWELAIKYFGEARKAAPTSPEALFNLALASDKAGGRELIAIAWYRAYLAGAPKATNTREVKARIADLEVKTEVTNRKLIQKAKEMESQVSESSSLKPFALLDIARAQAKAGDLKSAHESIERALTLGRATMNYEQWPLYHQKIAEARAAAGDIVRAKEMANLISPDTSIQKHVALISIANFLVTAGDIAGAKETLGTVRKMLPGFSAIQELFIDLTFAEIVWELVKIGDIAGAKKTADSIKDGQKKTDALKEIAEAQARANREVHSWEKLAVNDLSRLSIPDWQGFIGALRDKKPYEVAQTLADASSKVASALDKLRKNESYWQKRRLQSTR